MTSTPGIDALIPPNPDAAPKADPPKGDTPPAKKKRPTTRAGRAAAAAERKAAGKGKSDKAPSSTPRPRRSDLETRLTTSLATLGTGLVAAGSMTSPAVAADGILVIRQAPDVSKALADLAKNDPRVAAALERMLTVGTYGALVAAVAPLMIGIAANHGAIPAHVAGMVGVELPDPSELFGQPVDPTGDTFDPSPPNGQPAPGSVGLG